MKILHVLDMALPDLATGYAVRSDYILTNQKRIGLEPIVLTRYSHSKHVGGEGCAEMREDIPYLWGPSAESHFVPLQRLGSASPALYELAQQGSEKQFRNRLVDAVEEHTPDVIHVASPATNAIIAA